jgi:predicted Zn-dependent protease
MKKVLAVVAVIVLAASGFLGVRLWRGRVAQAQEARALSRAESLFAKGQIAEAAAIVQTLGQRPGNRLAWGDIDFRVLVAQMNLPRLTAIYQSDPNRILADEAASLTVARAFLHLRQPPDFERIRSAWKGREKDPARWQLLDADHLLLDGDSAKAEELLRSTTFPGTNDVPRLLRLALVTAARNPKESVEFLNRAVTLDPRQPDTRSFRGQVLEALGRPADARVEYVAAVVAAPTNPVWRDQLAEFYRRRGTPDLALKTWTDALRGPAFDAMWLKTAFWSRMIAPSDLASVSNRPSPGPLIALYQFIRDLPDHRFFDTNAFDSLSGNRRFSQERPEVFWLRLTDLLAQGNEAEALEWLAAPRPAGSALEPYLERALARILTWRHTTNHTLLPRGLQLTRITRPSTNLHSLFVTLEQQAQAEEARPLDAARPASDLDAFLAGPHAFAGAFLAAGWREAAIRLAGDVPVTADSPVWLTYGLAQALRYNRGNTAALQFLATHRNNPALDLLAAEIRIAEGKTEEGRAALLSLATKNSDIGMRAAWLLSIDALDHGNPDEARRLVRSNPVLASHTTGQELLARAALSEGETNAAVQAYESIADHSAEAQAFLARQAFAERNWDRAQSLTLSLLDLMPDQLTLRANLEKIAAARVKP